MLNIRTFSKVLLISFLAVLTAGCQKFTANTSSSNNTVGSEVIFSNKGKVYSFNTTTKQQTPLPITIENSDPSKNVDISWLTVSPDKKKLFMNVNFMDLYIYDFANKTTKVLADFGPNAKPEEFSPDGNYAIIDTGLAPGDRGATLIRMDGTIIDSDSGNSYVFAPNSQKYLLSKGDVELCATGTGPCQTSDSIYLKSIQDKVITTKLLSGNNKVSYAIKEWKDNDTFIAVKKTFSEPIPQNPTNDQISSSIFTSKWSKIFDSPKEEYISFHISTKSSEKTDVTSRNQPIASDISPDGKWKLVTKSNDNNKRMISIQQTNGNDNISVGEGDDAVWR